MKKHLKVKMAIIISLVLMFLLAACGDGSGTGARAIPNEERIQNDISTNAISPISGGRTVTGIDLLEYETDSEMGQHSAFARVFSNDGEVAFTEHMRVSYMQNEEREWVLSNISFDHSSPVLMSPLAGVRDELAREALVGATLVINDDEWVISYDTLESLSVVSRETSLEQNRDVVTVNVQLHDIALIAEGEMVVEFRFDNGWQAGDFRVSSPFETSIHPHAVLDVSDDELIAIITRHNIAYSPRGAIDAQAMITMAQGAVDLVGTLTGMPFLSALFETSGTGEQTMSISEDEISEFTFLDAVATERGTVKTFFSSFTLSKEFVTFDVFSQVVYSFDPVNGWGLHDVGFTSVINAVNLEGTSWVGTYTRRDGGTYVFLGGAERITMEITSISHLTDIDGAIEVEINIYPTQRSRGTGAHIPPGEWRQTARGFVNFVELTFEIMFDEWIVPPPATGPRSNPVVSDGISLSGRFDVETATARETSPVGRRFHGFRLALTDEIGATVDLGEVSDYYYEDEYENYYEENGED